MEAYRLRGEEIRPPAGVSPAMLILTSMLSAVAMVLAPRIGIVVSLIFFLYWAVQIIRTAKGPIERERTRPVRRKPLRELGPEFLVIVALQLPWLAGLLAHRADGPMFATLVVLLPVISILAYRGFGNSR